MTTTNRIVTVAALSALGAIASPLYAQSCEAAPLYDVGGPSCGASRQNVECGCSECLMWDVTQNADWYEIRRCDDKGANCTIVGDTRWKNHAAYTDDDGLFHPLIAPTMWCAAWDAPFPALSQGYEFAVRACLNGTSGPVCSATFSTPVGYVGAPYMCIDNGIEVPCRAGVVPDPAFSTDSDGDGVTDVDDLDDDGDGVTDGNDNCPLTINIGQRDADRDGVGDACDLEPRAPGSVPSDVDRDGIADHVDVCSWVYDPLQADADHDHIGDACDDCPAMFNDRQSDADRDGQGDACDLNDGTIYGVFTSRSQLAWDKEVGFLTWSVYRGDLAELRRSTTYTQLPGSNPMAASFCGLGAMGLADGVVPTPGTTAFYLVAGRPGSPQNDLGFDSAGNLRLNSNPCP